MSDALDRLKRKTRPKVQPRSTQVSTASAESVSAGQSQPPSSTYPPNGSADSSTSRHIDIETSKAVADRDPSTSVPALPSLGDRLESRHTEVQTSRVLEDIDVKRSTFRLEAGLISRLHRKAQDHGISREVLVEAMYEYVEANPEAMAQVLSQAAQKNEHRQQLANRKRAQAMIEKFG